MQRSAEQQLVRERDFYRDLVELANQDEVEPFLEDALGLVVAMSDAERGYLELGAPDAEQRYWLAHGCTEAEAADIRQQASRGIVAEALATGETIQTASALTDPRFEGRVSVRENRIEGVLCVPVGAPPVGVVYLQGRRGGGVFGAEIQRYAELFAQQVGPLAHRLLRRRGERAVDDPTLPYRAKLRAEGLVGRSAALADVLRQVTLVAPLDVAVLLSGPSGTGKTALARVIAASGPRAGGPFVQLNCAALPPALFESELFGAERGAHSTATRATPGKVAAAERGTLLLDEVSELAAEAQGKLLQLLQSGTYYRLGGTRAIQADARIIAATNTDLAEHVADGRFREDLFYRLQVLPIRLPTLAERREDVGLLAQAFCAAACDRHGLPRLHVGPAALHALETAAWPGNVRQLAHAVEAAAIRAHGEGATAVAAHHVFPDASSAPEADAPEGEGGGLAGGFQEATLRFQRRLVEDTLRATGWNVAEAARRLGVARSHAYNLIRTFGLARDGGAPARTGR